MKKTFALFILSMALCASSVTSCNNDVFNLSKGSGISIKVGATADLRTRSSAVETVVLKSLDPGAPDLYVVSSPYTPDAPSTRSAAVTSATIGSVYPTFYLDAYIDGQSEAYFDHKGVTYDAGKNEWALEHDGEDEPYRWSWNKEKDKFDEIAFWALACDDEFSGMYDSVTDNSASMSFSYNDFKSGQATPYTKDLLVAYNKKSEGTLEIKFAHALAAVSAIVDPEQEPGAVIKDCSFNNVLSQGNCTCAPSGEGVSFAWEASQPESYAASFDGTDALSADNLHFIIPQTLGADATVSITVERNGATRTHTYSLSGTTWEAGKKYVYKLGYPSGAILLDGPAFWDAVDLLVSSSPVIEDVEFKVASPISDYPGLPYTMVQDPTSKAKIYAVYDSSSKKLIVTTGADEMFANVSMERMFKGYKTNSDSMDGAFGALKSIEFGPLNTVKTTSMQRTFDRCRILNTLDLSGFDTANVTTMSGMFAFCEKLAALDLSGFDTSNVTDMKRMFGYCEKLAALDLSGFDTSNVTDMSFMFYYCEKLAALDLSGFNTSNVTDMRSMFYECFNITSIDLSGFVTNKVTNMSYMFRECESLVDLKGVEDFDTSNVTQMTQMFARCRKLKKLDLSKYDVSKVTEFTHIFYEDESLEELNLSGWVTSQATSMRSLFYWCDSLSTLDLSSFDTRNVMQFQFFLSSAGIKNLILGPDFVFNDEILAKVDALVGDEDDEDDDHDSNPFYCFIYSGDPSYSIWCNEQTYNDISDRARIIGIGRFKWTWEGAVTP